MYGGSDAEGHHSRDPLALLFVQDRGGESVLLFFLNNVFPCGE